MVCDQYIVDCDEVNFYCKHDIDGDEMPVISGGAVYYDFSI
jgi:hypothetical protein